MLIEKTPNYSLYGKTSWGPEIDTNVGWFVGYIESKNNVHFFATNLKITDAKDLPVRREIVREALRIEGIL